MGMYLLSMLSKFDIFSAINPLTPTIKKPLGIKWVSIISTKKPESLTSNTLRVVQFYFDIVGVTGSSPVTSIA